MWAGDYRQFRAKTCSNWEYNDPLMTDCAELNGDCSRQVTRHEILPIFTTDGDRASFGCCPHAEASNEPRAGSTQNSCHSLPRILSRATS
jgi:hypothetical protein